jgi:hypothetical protein
MASVRSNLHFNLPRGTVPLCDHGGLEKDWSFMAQSPLRLHD